MADKFAGSAARPLPNGRVVVAYRFEGTAKIVVAMGVGYTISNNTDAVIELQEQEDMMPSRDFTMDWLRKRYPDLTPAEASSMFADVWKALP